jgi:hypothetical protein
MAHPKGKLLFKTFRDITNATKHWDLNADNKLKQVVSEVSTPVIADWGAYFLHGPVMYVAVGAARPSMPELASMAMKCLVWILKGPMMTIPADFDRGFDVIFRPLAK